eukprot:gene3603-4042_t
MCENSKLSARTKPSHPPAVYVPGTASCGSLAAPTPCPGDIAPSPLVDIGINVCSKAMRGKGAGMIRRAQASGVRSMLLTGTSVPVSMEAAQIARQFPAGTLFCTVGVHPHDAKAYGDGTTGELRALLKSSPHAVAVGECGLDFNRNFRPRTAHIAAFAAQAALAIELGLPLFLHERDAHKACLPLDFTLPVSTQHEYMAPLQRTTAASL